MFMKKWYFSLPFIHFCRRFCFNRCLMINVFVVTLNASPVFFLLSSLEKCAIYVLDRYFYLISFHIYLFFVGLLMRQIKFSSFVCAQNVWARRRRSHFECGIKMDKNGSMCSHIVHVIIRGAAGETNIHWKMDKLLPNTEHLWTLPKNFARFLILYVSYEKWKRKKKTTKNILCWHSDWVKGNKSSNLVATARQWCCVRAYKSIEKWQ